MQCSRPAWLSKRGINVPCGRCMPCRIRRVAEWTMRLTHQFATMNYQGMFVTLTYSDEHLPYEGTLVKEDLQKFFKRLRKRCAPKKIKYYASGEYGGLFGRPHYHAIILGLSCGDKVDRQMVIDSWDYCEWNPIRAMKSIQPVNDKTMRYTAKYIQDKFYGTEEQLAAQYGGALPEFQLSSQGIGKDWMLSNIDFINKTGKVLYRGKEMALPKYYKDKADIDGVVITRNFMDMRKSLRSKFGINVLDDFINQPFTGYNLDYRYIDSLNQREKNILAKQGLAESSKIKYNLIKGVNNENSTIHNL